MKAISLWRPWAGMVVLGWKTIETRLHRRFDSLKGTRIAIHAAQKNDRTALAAAGPYLDERQRNAFFHASAFERQVLQRDGIVGTVFVAETAKLLAEDSPAALIDCSSGDRYGLFLEEPVLFKRALPFHGMQGIFNVPDDMVEAALLEVSGDDR